MSDVHVGSRIRIPRGASKVLEDVIFPDGTIIAIDENTDSSNNPVWLKFCDGETPVKNLPEIVTNMLYDNKTHSYCVHCSDDCVTVNVGHPSDLKSTQCLQITSHSTDFYGKVKITSTGEFIIE